MILNTFILLFIVCNIGAETTDTENMGQTGTVTSYKYTCPGTISNEATRVTMRATGCEYFTSYKSFNVYIYI